MADTSYFNPMRHIHDAKAEGPMEIGWVDYAKENFADYPIVEGDDTLKLKYAPEFKSENTLESHVIYDGDLFYEYVTMVKLFLKIIDVSHNSHKNVKIGNVEVVREYGDFGLAENHFARAKLTLKIPYEVEE